LVCTDPPYQLASITKRFGKQDSTPAKFGKDGAYQRVSKGFMGKEWDVLPPVELWKEVLRVMKSGAFAFIMTTPRQDSLCQILMDLSQAGFVMGFSSIYYSYATGFPKASNMGKMVDKRFGGKYDITNGSSELEGSYAGFQPKPAVEIIIVAMKPLSEKSYIDQAMKNKKGVTWLDDCKIPTTKIDEKQNRKITRNKNLNNKEKGWGMNNKDKQEDVQVVDTNKGRFPANLLVSDDSLNDGKDKGSYSRYFDLDSWWEEKIKKLPENVKKVFPFLITPKPSKKEKNKRCENLEEKDCQPAGLVGAINKGTEKPRQKRNNNHPTVKPIKLMSYLITLGSREGDVILDPFMGSGTTGISAKLLNRKFIGIEMNKEYIKIASARIKGVIKEVK